MFGLHRCVAAHREKVKSFFFFLGSSQSCSDYAHKASQKLGEVNRGQEVLQPVKQFGV